MESRPLVTINIPTFNQERYIARAIESALAQDYSNLEIVVSDDCSTDGTFEVARSFASDKVRVHRNERNLGRVKNYRHCLYELARGDWVVNLDGDDYYDDPSFVSVAIAKVAADPDILMYAAGAKAFIESRSEMQVAPMAVVGDEQCLDGVDYVLGYPKLGAFQHFAVVYRRQPALETGFYVLDSLGTDTDSLCRLALRGRVFIHRKHVGVWTHHAHNASYTLTEEGAVREMHMLEHIAAALAQHVPEPVWRGWLQARQAEKRKLIENLTLLRLPTPEAWRYLWQRKRLEPFYLREAIKLVLRSLGLLRRPPCAG